MHKKPLSDSTYSSLSATDTLSVEDVVSAVKMLEEATRCKKHKIKFRMMMIPVWVCPKCNKAHVGNVMIDKKVLFPKIEFDPMKVNVCS